MAWSRRSCRVAADYGFLGAVVGFVVSVIGFVVLMGTAMWIDRGERADRNMGCNCLLRMAALLLLTFGLGVGYMVGRSMMGR